MVVLLYNGRPRLFETNTIRLIGVRMSPTKQEVTRLLERLPDDASIEDVQYHLYVMEKVRNGLEAAQSEGAVTQEQVEESLGKWLIT